MTKQSLINQINTLAGEYEEGNKAYNIAKLTVTELEAMAVKAEEMVKMSNVSKMLLEDYTQIQLVNALLDGTTDQMLARAIELKRAAKNVAVEINVY